METFIATNGDALIHDACEANFAYTDLAYFKMQWLRDHHEVTEEDSVKLINRFVTYQERLAEASKKHADAEPGSEFKKHMLYRKNYYEVLTKMFSDWLAGLVVFARTNIS